MLVIQRRPEETIRIGDDITVRVLGIVGNSVKIGIDAPRSITVHREEVYEAIQRENEAATRSTKRIQGLL